MEIDGAAGDITLVRPAAAAPPRRPEQVELRRARVFGDHPPREKEHHPASRKCRRESTPQKPVNAAFDQGGRRRRPRSSTAAAASFAPIARAPSAAPNRNITKWKSTAPPATSPSCGQQPLHHPGGPSRSSCAAPESSATTRQGIKNTISPAGNVGERARRRMPANAAFDQGGR